MARTSADQKRAAKDAKQKKILFVLLPIFLLLLVWQGPGYVSMLTGGGEEPVATASPTAMTTAPTTTAPTAPGAPPSTAAGAAPTATTAVGADSLPDSDVPAAAATDQLVTFDLFSAKNPFEQQVEANATPTDGGGATNGSGGSSSGGSFSGSGSGSGGSGSGSGSGSGGSGSGSGGTGGTQTARAVLSVNDSTERLATGSAFPKSDPVFLLASIGSSSVQIGLVSGSFSSGSKTTKLSVGRTLTLVSQPDGLRYTIELVRIS
jgi:hypothetical protein